MHPKESHGAIMKLVGEMYREEKTKKQENSSDEGLDEMVKALATVNMDS
jgi:hypothetical protein